MHEASAGSGVGEQLSKVTTRIPENGCCPENGLSRFHAGVKSGCVRALNEINDELNPTVRFRALLEQWKKSLTFWQRFMWRIGIRHRTPIVD